jgi:DNA invertase Pin-like site-specific DNA recombinase
MRVANRVVLYRRVSTEEQQLGLDSQLAFLEVEAERRGWTDVEWVTDEAVSGATPAEDRPALGPVLATLQPGDVLVVHKLDRLSRSVLDFARLLERAEKGAWSIVVLDLGVDMTSPQGKLVANILVAVAQWEREVIALRIKEGMARSPKTMGRPRGSGVSKGSQPSALSPQLLAAVEDLRDAGKSPHQIALRLNAQGHRSPRGKDWHRTSVRRLLDRLDREAELAAA